MAAERAIRASDGDRDRVVEILREQTAQGRLTFEEFEERIDRAYTARTWDELKGLTDDLPVRTVFAGERTEVVRKASLGERAREIARDQGRQTWLLPALVLGVVTVVLVGAWEISPLVLLGLVWIASGSCGKGQRRTYACGPRPVRTTPPRDR